MVAMIWPAAEHNNTKPESSKVEMDVPEKKLKRHSSGLKWRRSILLGAFFCGISLAINIAGAVVAGRSVLRTDGDRRILFQGDCAYTRRLNICIHLGINLLSTVLLASSNYAMQCLSAPTRTELDRAHAEGKWLDIGILSFRNLARIKTVRVLFWLFLGVSSVSLHLVFNSVFHESLSTHDYFVFQATESMMSKSLSLSRRHIVPRMKAWEQGGMPLSPLGGSSTAGVFIDNTQGEVERNITYENLWQKVIRSDLERLDNEDCIRQYSSPLINRRRHLILVVPGKYDAKANTTFLGLYRAEFKRKSHSAKCNRDGYDWLCEEALPDCHWGDGCSKLARKIDSHNWKTFQERKPEYCLSEKVSQTCALHFSSNLAWVVVSFNALKLLLLLVCCLSSGPLGKEQPLLTVGDAISSFLRRNDKTTEHLSASRTSNLWTGNGIKDPEKLAALTKGCLEWKRYRLHHAVPRRRWILLTLHFVIISILLLACLASSIDETVSASQALSIALGAVDVRTMLSPNGKIQKYLQASFIRAVLLANSPQLVLSALYIAFNRVLTTFALAREVNAFSIRPKGLRVSYKPQGSQRSGYFLELPYRFSLPLMLFSGILHWICSQSLFFVSIFKASAISTDNQNSTLAYDSREILTLGYSPQAILILTLLVILMYAMLLCFGLRQFTTIMPVSGSCSAVISALCHQPAAEDGDEAVLKPLMFGVSSEEIRDGVDVVECSFSSREMRQLDDYD